MAPTRVSLVGGLLAFVCTGTAFAQGAAPRQAPLDQAGLNRLASDTGGAADVSINAATGAARFVRVTPGQTAGLDTAGAARGAATARSAQAAQVNAQEAAQARATRSMAFLRRYAGVFGLSNPDAELTLVNSATDAYGGGHLTYVQRYAGVPVLGGVLKTHFSGADELTAVNGTVVPQLSLNIRPARSSGDASATAVRTVSSAKNAANLTARGARLIVYREGLLKGVPGDNHLTWEVEVGNGSSVREFVYVDAHSGKVIDQITGVQDGLFRRAYDGQFLPAVPPTYPGTPYWVEGDPFPTASAEANNMIVSSKETYDFFHTAFGRDSFDGAGAIMDSIFNRGYGCPNASWNGIFISFCNGFTTDDVTAHEWGHAYTQYTDNLIYAWQSGALNEAYSDIWGETVDQLNGRGFDTPGLRTDNSCTTYQTSSPAPILTVNSPASIAGEYDARGAAFGGALPDAGLTSDLVLAQPADGCTPLTNAAAVAGKVAIMDRGTCGFVVKVKTAQDAGATGVVMVNNVAGAPIAMGGADPTITIPSLMISLASGNTIKASLPGVNATLKPSGLKIDNTVRWLLGEEVGNVPGTGALRDMWNPSCYSNPGKVSDRFYYCDTVDQGGVHTNSGVINHTYALLVDGGSYNGQTITSIGLTKAAHIHFRAQTTYLVPTSDFFDHAEALAQSCSDLIGVNLTNLQTGAPSGQMITAGDCQQVAKAALATELRTAPVQCNFQPLLQKNPPARCGPDTTQVNIFTDDFEHNPRRRWTVSHQAVVPADFTERDWVWTSDTPHGGTGAAFFGADPNLGTCAPGGDESAVLHLDSPSISLPNGVTTPLLEFDHWLATEAGWDGGNVKVSVNGGPWQVIAAAAFTFNPYNATLFAVADGNTNPLAGQPAFTGTDGGTNAGSWGRSYVNLSAYATAGDSVKLRFDIGNDGCTGVVGWYVDNVTVHACTANAEPQITINDIDVVEGNAGFTQGKFTVSLSHAYAKPVTVFYFTFDGSAHLLSDYLPTLGVITIPPLSISKTLPVNIIGDRRRESDETFFVGLVFPFNGMIADGVGACKIVNDDGSGTH